MTKIYDIIIVGAGPSGLTSALYAERAGRSVLLIEKESFGGQIVLSPNVENYPMSESMSGMELTDKLVASVMALGTEFEVGTVTEVLNDESGNFKVRTDYSEFLTRTLIIATGLKHKMLGIEHEQRFVGSGISFCAVCDGSFYKDKVVAVVGGGNTAVQDAVYLAKICKKVYLIHRRDTFRAEEYVVKKIKQCSNIEPLMSSQVTALYGDTQLEQIKIKTDTAEKMLDVSALFVAIGQAPVNEIFKDLVELDDNGFVKANESCRTENEAIFVAGDCRSKSVRQLVTACADGAVAAIAACEYLETRKESEDKK